jgi:hypothetical protein
VEQPRRPTGSAEELDGLDQQHVRRQQPVLPGTNGILSVFQLVLEFLWDKTGVKPVDE